LTRNYILLVASKCRNTNKKPENDPRRSRLRARAHKMKMKTLGQACLKRSRVRRAGILGISVVKMKQKNDCTQQFTKSSTYPYSNSTRCNRSTVHIENKNPKLKIKLRKGPSGAPRLNVVVEAGDCDRGQCLRQERTKWNQN
jgi:hypothetical protein